MYYIISADKVISTNLEPTKTTLNLRSSRCTDFIFHISVENRVVMRFCTSAVLGLNFDGILGWGFLFVFLWKMLMMSRALCKEKQCTQYKAMHLWAWWMARDKRQNQAALKLYMFSRSPSPWKERGSRKRCTSLKTRILQASIE